MISKSSCFMLFILTIALLASLSFSQTISLSLNSTFVSGSTIQFVLTPSEVIPGGTVLPFGLTHPANPGQSYWVRNDFLHPYVVNQNELDVIPCYRENQLNVVATFKIVSTISPPSTDNESIYGLELHSLFPIAEKIICYGRMAIFNEKTTLVENVTFIKQLVPDSWSLEESVVVSALKQISGVTIDNMEYIPYVAKEEEKDEEKDDLQKVSDSWIPSENDITIAYDTLSFTFNNLPANIYSLVELNFDASFTSSLESKLTQVGDSLGPNLDQLIQHELNIYFSFINKVHANEEYQFICKGSDIRLYIPLLPLKLEERQQDAFVPLQLFVITGANPSTSAKCSLPINVYKIFELIYLRQMQIQSEQLTSTSVSSRSSSDLQNIDDSIAISITLPQIISSSPLQIISQSTTRNKLSQFSLTHPKYLKSTEETVIDHQHTFVYFTQTIRAFTNGNNNIAFNINRLEALFSMKSFFTTALASLDESYYISTPPTQSNPDPTKYPLTWTFDTNSKTYSAEMGQLDNAWIEITLIVKVPEVWRSQEQPKKNTTIRPFIMHYSFGPYDDTTLHAKGSFPVHPVYYARSSTKEYILSTKTSLTYIFTLGSSTPFQLSPIDLEFPIIFDKYTPFYHEIAMKPQSNGSEFRHITAAHPECFHLQYDEEIGKEAPSRGPVATLIVNAFESDELRLAPHDRSYMMVRGYFTASDTLILTCHQKLQPGPKLDLDPKNGVTFEIYNRFGEHQSVVEFEKKPLIPWSWETLPAFSSSEGIIVDVEYTNDITTLDEFSAFTASIYNSLKSDIILTDPTITTNLFAALDIENVVVVSKTPLRVAQAYKAYPGFQREITFAIPQSEQDKAQNQTYVRITDLSAVEGARLSLFFHTSLFPQGTDFGQFNSYFIPSNFAQDTPSDTPLTRMTIYSHIVDTVTTLSNNYLDENVNDNLDASTTPHFKCPVTFQDILTDSTGYYPGCLRFMGQSCYSSASCKPVWYNGSFIETMCFDGICQIDSYGASSQYHRLFPGRNDTEILHPPATLPVNGDSITLLSCSPAALYDNIIYISGQLTCEFGDCFKVGNQGGGDDGQEEQIDPFYGLFVTFPRDKFTFTPDATFDAVVTIYSPSFSPLHVTSTKIPLIVPTGTASQLFYTFALDIDLEFLTSQPSSNDILSFTIELKSPNSSPWKSYVQNGTTAPLAKFTFKFGSAPLSSQIPFLLPLGSIPPESLHIQSINHLDLDASPNQIDIPNPNAKASLIFGPTDAEQADHLYTNSISLTVVIDDINTSTGLTPAHSLRLYPLGLFQSDTILTLLATMKCSVYDRPSAPMNIHSDRTTNERYLQVSFQNYSPIQKINANAMMLKCSKQFTSVQYKTIQTALAKGNYGIAVTIVDKNINTAQPFMGLLPFFYPQINTKSPIQQVDGSINSVLDVTTIGTQSTHRLIHIDQNSDVSNSVREIRTVRLKDNKKIDVYRKFYQLSYTYTDMQQLLANIDPEQFTINKFQSIAMASGLDFKILATVAQARDQFISGKYLINCISYIEDVRDQIQQFTIALQGELRLDVDSTPFKHNDKSHTVSLRPNAQVEEIFELNNLKCIAYSLDLSLMFESLTPAAKDGDISLPVFTINYQQVPDQPAPIIASFPHMVQTVAGLKQQVNLMSSRYTDSSKFTQALTSFTASTNTAETSVDDLQGAFDIDLVQLDNDALIDPTTINDIYIQLYSPGFKFAVNETLLNRTDAASYVYCLINEQETVLASITDYNLIHISEPLVTQFNGIYISCPAISIIGHSTHFSSQNTHQVNNGLQAESEDYYNAIYPLVGVIIPGYQHVYGGYLTGPNENSSGETEEAQTAKFVDSVGFIILIVLLIVLLVAACILGYFYYRHRKAEKKHKNGEQQPLKKTDLVLDSIDLE